MKTQHLLILVLIIVVILLVVWYYHDKKNNVINAPKPLAAKPLSDFLVTAENGRGAELFTDLLAASECQKIVSKYHAKFGKQIAKHDATSTKHQFQKMVADQDLIDMVVGRISERAKKSANPNLRAAAEVWKPYSKVRVVHYLNGQEKTLHKDTKFSEGDWKSAYTCLVYLNEGYEGGRTLSYPAFTEQYRNAAKAPRPGTAERLQILASDPQIVVPKTGMSALYDIDLMHRGEAVQGEKWLLIFKLMLPKKPWMK